MKRSLGAAALAATTVLAVPATVLAHGSVYQGTAATGAGLTPETRYFVTNHGFSYVLKETNGITDQSGADAPPAALTLADNFSFPAGRFLRFGAFHSYHHQSVPSGGDPTLQASYNDFGVSMTWIIRGERRGGQ